MPPSHTCHLITHHPHCHLMIHDTLSLAPSLPGRHWSTISPTHFQWLTFSPSTILAIQPFAQHLAHSTAPSLRLLTGPAPMRTCVCYWTRITVTLHLCERVLYGSASLRSLTQQTPRSARHPTLRSSHVHRRHHPQKPPCQLRRTVSPPCARSEPPVWWTGGWCCSA